MNQLAPIKTLTPKQQVFVDALFNEADGDVRTAMNLAGYSPNYSEKELIGLIREHILERATTYLAFNTPKAVTELVGLVNNPVQAAAKEKLSAIKEVLDRAGLVKTERVTHNIEDRSAVILLPPKNKIDEDTEVQMVSNSEETQPPNPLGLPAR